MITWWFSYIFLWVPWIHKTSHPEIVDLNVDGTCSQQNRTPSLRGLYKHPKLLHLLLQFPKASGVFFAMFNMYL